MAAIAFAFPLPQELAAPLEAKRGLGSDEGEGGSTTARSSLTAQIIAGEGDLFFLSSPPSTPNGSEISRVTRFSSPLAPPPTTPLPPVPTSQILSPSPRSSNITSNVPNKPKLLPKRGHSRSPSPLASTIARFPSLQQEKIISASNTRRGSSSHPITVRANMMNPRPSTGDSSRPREQRTARYRGGLQAQQYGYALSGDEGEEGSQTLPARTGPKFSKVASSLDNDPTQAEQTFGDYIPMPMKSRVHQSSISTSDSSSVPSFGSRDGPMLLNTSVRRGNTSNLPSPTQQTFVSRPGVIAGQGTHLQQNDRGNHQSYSQSDVRAQGRWQGQAAPPSTNRSRVAPQESYIAMDDVVMRDEAVIREQKLDEEDIGDDNFDEADFESPDHPQMVDYSSQQYSNGNMMEPAWADDASVIDLDGDKYSRNPPEEVFEVAALRRQVEQLQMALKKQMAADRSKERSPQTPLRFVSSNNNLYPFGLPTPEPSRNGSSVGATVRVSPSKTSSRELYSDSIPHSTSQYHTNEDRRHYSALKHQQEQLRQQQQQQRLYSDSYTPSGRDNYTRQRLTSDPPTMSSLLPDESASSFIRPEDTKIEELSRKIQALEAMFQTSSLSPHQSETVPSPTRLLQHHAGPSNRTLQMDVRRPSVSTISTVEGSYGRKSPAASAFNYNATTSSPYSSEQDSFRRPSLGQQISPSSSTNSADQATRKGVARFIMGVGTSKGNIPRDEYGNPLPSMQVSWSRKRTEKVAKPMTNAKMKGGPGRGRIVMHPKPTPTKPL